MSRCVCLGSRHVHLSLLDTRMPIVALIAKQDMSGLCPTQWSGCRVCTQVLPMRTHPTMNCDGTGGYILSGIKTAPPEAAPSRQHKKAKY